MQHLWMIFFYRLRKSEQKIQLSYRKITPFQKFSPRTSFQQGPPSIVHLIYNPMVLTHDIFQSKALILHFVLQHLNKNSSCVSFNCLVLLCHFKSNVLIKEIQDRNRKINHPQSHDPEIAIVNILLYSLLIIISMIRV